MNNIQKLKNILHDNNNIFSISETSDELKTYIQNILPNYKELDDLKDTDNIFIFSVLYDSKTEFDIFFSSKYSLSEHMFFGIDKPYSCTTIFIYTNIYNFETDMQILRNIIITNF